MISEIGLCDEDNVRSPSVTDDASTSPTLENVDARLRTEVLGVLESVGQLRDRRVEFCGTGDPLGVQLRHLRAEPDKCHVDGFRPHIVRELGRQETGKVKASFRFSSE